MPKIHGYYEEILSDFSVNDVTHTLHQLLKMLENMQRLDAKWASVEDTSDVAVGGSYDPGPTAGVR